MHALRCALSLVSLVFGELFFGESPSLHYLFLHFLANLLLLYGHSLALYDIAWSLYGTPKHCIYILWSCVVWHSMTCHGHCRYNTLWHCMVTILNSMTHFGPGCIVAACGIHGMLFNRLKRQRVEDCESATLRRVQHPAITISFITICYHDCGNPR